MTTWKCEVSAEGCAYTVDAYRHGKFIVHLPIGQSIADNPDYAPDALWVVTHRATGLMATSVWGRANARRMARALDAATEADITSTDRAAKNEAWQAFSAAVAAMVKRESHLDDPA